MNLRATNNRNDFGRYHIRRNIQLVVIPHLPSLLPKIEVVGTPSRRAIASLGEWERASNNKHLAAVDHIARQRMVRIANPGSLPPLDPCERRKTEDVNIIETSIICAESKASI
jgi:hypothetical protein